MNVETASRLIQGVVFWPGWKFEVNDHCHRFENAVTVKVTYPAQDTSRENAATGYTCDEIEGGARASHTILLDRICCDEDLYAELLRVVQDIRQHEDREALRVGSTLWAPFHPHNTDGMERAERHGLGTVAGDLKFGLV
jgi:hypothetical protein